MGDGVSFSEAFQIGDIKRWFIVKLLQAIELRYDLRLYKIEKRIVTSRSEIYANDECDEKYFEPENVSNTVSSSFQQDKKKIDHDQGREGFNFYHNIVHDGTTENFVLKSAFGFSGGILLTYICYLFLIYSLNFTLRRATLICVGLGIVLSLGLAFSVRIRCTVLLCIPQLFSKRGRQALLAYAFILALSGPAKNTLHNVEVMSESLACGQEQLKKAENEMLKCVHRPNTAVRQSLEIMLLKLGDAVKGYKHFIERFYKECRAVNTIIHTREWLYNIYLLCTEKMGSPYSRCTDMLFEASQNCKAVCSSPDWVRACGISRIQELICPTKDEPICCVEDLPPFWPFLNHREELEEFRKKALNVILVEIETHQIFVQPNRPATLREEYQGMATEIRQKTDQFLQYFDVMSVIFGIFILVLFIKVIIYRYKFLTEDDYDNRFITSDFVDIDETRAEFRMQTLLPLEPREKKKYIKVTSMRLVPYERSRLLSSFVFLIFATFKIIIHMLTDCFLYWMLSTMRRHGRMLLVDNDEGIPQITMDVNGTGIYVDLLRNITKAVKPYDVQQIMDPIPCLPDPISPDWNRYYQILTLVLICWLLALCEPYGLRLRHIIMVIYHPDRARERAIWLYNRILTTRINFVKFARRQLRRRYKDVDEETFFRHGKPKWPRFRIISRPLECLLCKESLKDMEYIKCPTVGCIGIYCRLCFVTLQLCSICKDPSFYGDYSDVSEEKDSEEEAEKFHTSMCMCQQSQTYLRGGSVKDYHALQVNYNPVSNIRNSIYPKIQISMDTIIDLEGCDFRQSLGSLQEKKEDEQQPVMSSSKFTRIIHQCKKVFGVGDRSNDDGTERDVEKKGQTNKQEGLNDIYFFPKGEKYPEEFETSLNSNIRGCCAGDKNKKHRAKKPTLPRKVRKKSMKFPSPKNGPTNIEKIEKNQKTNRERKKEPLTTRILDRFRIFSWKLKDRLFEDGAPKETLLNYESRNVHFYGPEDDIIRQRESFSTEEFESSDEWMQTEGSNQIQKESSQYCPVHSREKQERKSFEDSSIYSYCPIHHAKRTKGNTFLNRFPLIERRRHPKFRTDNNSEKFYIQNTLSTMEGTNSGTEISTTSSALEFQNTGLTSKETQTQPESDSTVFPKFRGLRSSRMIQKNFNSSSGSSSRDAILKEFVHAKRRRQLNRTHMKGRQFEGRNVNSGRSARRRKRSYARYETTSESSPERKYRIRNRKSRIALTVTDADLILTNSAQKALTKKVDMMRAKLARFFKKSIKRQSSSEDGGTTEGDNDEYMPIADASFSDDEFQELSRKIEESKSEESNRKLIQAPDLLSDLPSSKTTDPSFIHYHADSDPEDEDNR